MTNTPTAAKGRKDGAESILKLNNVSKYFPITGGILRREVGRVYAVNNVSLAVKKGETLGIVGESGCGKSTLARTILRLYEPSGGEVIFKGQDLTKLDKKGLKATRRDMQMIFQDPYASLNPRMSVGAILEEPFVLHKIGTKESRQKKIAELLTQVGLRPDAIHRYPHEFSGGQRQRIGIARALALNPDVIICDEAVSALDVSVQSQVLNLLVRLQREFELTYLFISHDLTVVKYISDRIAVMYLGRVVELATSDDLYGSPRHPYTQALLTAVPIPDPSRKDESDMLEGDVPSPSNPPSGCHFHTRCKYATAHCKKVAPELKTEPGRATQVACHLRDPDSPMYTTEDQPTPGT
ncbi:MAG: hypothetical protein CMH57_00925 [Myxococcales bacterium]|nr:hypothetical protein [Myxococcales bacterium]